jgi:hypothetical protein
MPFTLDPNARDERNPDGSAKRDGSPDRTADPRTKTEPSARDHVVRNTDGSQSPAEFDPYDGNTIARANADKTYAEHEGAKAAAFDETGLTSAQVAAKRADNAANTNAKDLADANTAIAANKKAADNNPAADKKAAAETSGRTSDQRLADNTANRAADNATNRAADNKTNADAAKTYDTKPV